MAEEREEQKKPESRVVIRDSEMKAYLTLVPPEKGKEYTKDDLLGLLEEAGITDGIDSSRLAAMAKKHLYNREELVAEGKPAVPGQDGYYEYFFDTSDPKTRRPQIREDGSVDYTSVNVIECVNNGDKLAVYHPAVQGETGITVKGKVIPPKRVKELRPFLTAGCTFDSETQTYTATMDGRIERTNTKLSVIGLKEYNQDINNVFGDITFKGDVVIHGTVRSGINITATKSVTIDGIFHGASITAGEDIIVKGGILGNGTAVVKCNGDLLAGFIEYTTVEAGGNVSANHIIASKLLVNGMVTATGGFGAIVGGLCRAIQGIDSVYLGNDVGLQTRIYVGISDNMENQYQDLCKQEKEISDRLKEVSTRLDEIERDVRTGIADELTMAERKNLMREKIEIKAEVTNLRQKIMDFDDLRDRAENVRVIARGKAYSGVMIYMGDQQYFVDIDRTSVQFFMDDNGNLLPRPFNER
ncbi:hypothetical protein SAMN06296386_1189 [Lachnospiraceae bacterium]|nr:hypothetical protein SAMN06296386_1189 [Lachnospiraceae bacterium]